MKAGDWNSWYRCKETTRPKRADVRLCNPLRLKKMHTQDQVECAQRLMFTGKPPDVFF